MTELQILLFGVMFGAIITGVSILAKMASDLTIIRRIAQVYEVRSAEDSNREYRLLKARIERRATLGELAERIVELAGQREPRGHDPDGPDRLQIALDVIRDRIKYLGAKRPPGPNRDGFIEGLEIAAVIVEDRISRPPYPPAGNYCSTCDLHDSWCEHIRPPGGAV